MGVARKVNGSSKKVKDSIAPMLAAANVRAATSLLPVDSIHSNSGAYNSRGRPLGSRHSLFMPPSTEDTTSLHPAI